MTLKGKKVNPIKTLAWESTILFASRGQVRRQDVGNVWEVI